MKIKRLFGVLLTLTMVIGLLPGLTLTASASVTSGTCGANGGNVTWSYDAATKTITFSGKGDMATYDVNKNRPEWVNLYCDEIENVVIEDDITSIANVAFYNCVNLKNVSIPDTVTAIYGNAFNGCSSLEEIKIPSSVEKIEGQAFSNCSSLKEVILPNIEELSSWIFNKCSNITGITIPDTVKTVNGYCFTNSAVKEITLPSSVNTVSYSLFQNVPYLTEVTIPASVTKLNNATFYNSSNLKRVYYLGAKDVEYTTNTMKGTHNFTVYVSNDYKDETFAGITPVKTTLHAITFDMGGYGIKPTERYAADGLIMEEPFVHSDENAIFQGWYKDAERTEKWDFATDTVNSDTVLYAKWKVKEKFSVTFNLNGYGSGVPENQTVTENSKVTKPVEPTADDYVFGGWYKEAECNNVWDFNVDVVTAATTLYAKWIEIPETVEITLDSTYGTCDTKTTTTYSGSTLSKELPTPTPNDTIFEGYWFKGWYDAPTGGNEITADTKFIIDTTIYAQWDVVKPEITKFDSERVYFTFPKSDAAITVVFADYASWDDPTFVGVKYVTVTTEKTQGENTISVAVPTGMTLWAGDRILMLENFSTVKPLCEMYRVTGSETNVEDTNEGIDLPIDRN